MASAYHVGALRPRGAAEDERDTAGVRAPQLDVPLGERGRASGVPRRRAPDAGAAARAACRARRRRGRRRRVGGMPQRRRVRGSPRRPRDDRHGRVGEPRGDPPRAWPRRLRPRARRARPAGVSVGLHPHGLGQRAVRSRSRSSSPTRSSTGRSAKRSSRSALVAAGELASLLRAHAAYRPRLSRGPAER